VAGLGVGRESEREKERVRGGRVSRAAEIRSCRMHILAGRRGEGPVVSNEGVLVSGYRCPLNNIPLARAAITVEIELWQQSPTHPRSLSLSLS
jgi:hypothetical protein